MEKNDEIKTIHTPTNGKNKKLIALVSIVAVLVIAGVAYLTVTLLNLNKDDGDKAAAPKPKLVAPEKIQSSLKAVNETAKEAYDAHASTKAAFDEQPVKLVE